MLRDPKHDLDIDNFRAFVASKDPDETYDFLLKPDCACGQWAKHLGLFDSWMDRLSLHTSESPWFKFNTLARKAKRAFPNTGHIALFGLCRWGDLLKVIDEYIATQNKSGDSVGVEVKVLDQPKKLSRRKRDLALT